MTPTENELPSPSGTSPRNPQHRKSRWRWIPWSLVALGGVVWGVYEYQPLRYDFIPRRLPAHNPWTDPDSAALFRSGARVAIVTAHPDDAEFYIGGLLTRLGQSGAHLSLIVTTDGDKGYYPFENAEENRRVRRQEQRDTAAMWNAQEVVFLGYPDGRVYLTDELIAKIAGELKRLQPEYILLFDGDYPPRLSHRDHRVTGEATEQAARQAGVGKWLLRFSTIAPNFAVDVTREWPRKMDLLRVHKSQFFGEKRARVQEMVTHSAEEIGKRLGVRYAEGLRCTQLR